MDTAPGRGGRWRMHDLLRLYAARLSDACADADGREQARDRLLGYYLSMADAADGHLRALPGTAVPEEFTGRDAALAKVRTSQKGLLSCSIAMCAHSWAPSAPPSARPIAIG